jgi:hypothetical protein
MHDGEEPYIGPALMIKWEFFTSRKTGVDYSPWLWQWRQIHPDGRVVESTETFPNLPACAVNARKYGYEYPDSQGSDPPSSGKQIRARA